MSVFEWFLVHERKLDVGLLAFPLSELVYVGLPEKESNAESNCQFGKGAVAVAESEKGLFFNLAEDALCALALGRRRRVRREKSCQEPISSPQMQNVHVIGVDNANAAA